MNEECNPDTLWAQSSLPLSIKSSFSDDYQILSDESDLAIEDMHDSTAKWCIILAETKMTSSHSVVDKTSSSQPEIHENFAKVLQRQR